jgi:nicotinamide mononucleotide transporter
VTVLDRLLHELSPLEVAGAIATLLNVWLIVRVSLWSWAWGIVAGVLYTIVFWRANLWSSTALQAGFFLPMQLYGWWHWLRAGPQHDDDLPVTVLTPTQRVAWFAGALVLAIPIGFGMRRLGAQQPFVDAGVTALSMAGQVLMAHKRREHWLFWIVVNTVYAVWLLPRQSLWVSATLYFILLGLAIKGWLEWRPTQSSPVLA